MSDSLITTAANRTGTEESAWRMIGLAAVHESVTPSDDCKFLGSAIIRGGYFRGGYFYGGYFRGGYFYGGNFHGGYFRGGDFRGGVFRGGVFRGGYWRRSPVFVQGTQYSVCESDSGNITSGCMTKPAEWWAENVRRTAEHNGYSTEQVDEYEAIFKFVISRIESLGVVGDEKEPAES